MAMDAVDKEYLDHMFDGKDDTKKTTEVVVKNDGVTHELVMVSHHLQSQILVCCLAFFFYEKIC